MLTPQGHAKVMDFGLAKKVVTDDGTEQDLTSGLTREGSTLGTPAYMSPEQVRAEQVDHRTDIFSFGIIFYEMLTGVHPFRRSRPVETMGAILHEEPEPLAKHLPGSTESVQQTVNQLLAKDPDDRIQTVEALKSRLNQLSSPELRLKAFLASRLGKRLALALTALIAIGLIGWWALREGPTEVGGPIISSIAVLPLENLSGDPEQDYFVDGMTDALITDLSKIGALQVIARHSAMRYKGAEKPLSEIAEELNVEAIIEGTVLREADQVQITAQLTEAATGQNLWADTYERKLTSMLALHGEVAQTIARQIQMTLSPEEEALLTRTRVVNPEAYEAYLKGQFHLGKLTRPDLETALQYFELSLEKDPNYAPAYGGIAISWGSLMQMGWVPPREARANAMKAALKAIELDETLAESHYSMACIRTWTDWDWEGAAVNFRRAIELNPNYADVRAFYSHFLLIVRREDEAIAQMERALELDPYRDLFQALYAVILGNTGRYDEAIAVYRNILRTVPNHPMALAGMVELHHQKGMYEEAFEALKAQAAVRRGLEAVEAYERDYAEGGLSLVWSRGAEWRAARSRPPYARATSIAWYYMKAENNQKALDWLERGFEERDPNMPYIGGRGYKGMRDEPRYQDLLRRMNFPEDVIARILDDTK